MMDSASRLDVQQVWWPLHAVTKHWELEVFDLGFTGESPESRGALGSGGLVAIYGAQGAPRAAYRMYVLRTEGA